MERLERQKWNDEKRKFLAAFWCLCLLILSLRRAMQETAALSERRYLSNMWRCDGWLRFDVEVVPGSSVMTRYTGTFWYSFNAPLYEQIHWHWIRSTLMIRSNQQLWKRTGFKEAHLWIINPKPIPSHNMAHFIFYVGFFIRCILTCVRGFVFKLWLT